MTTGNRRAMTPGRCPNEGAVADIGGGKSYCTPWERWTNCREVGHCTLETAKNENDGKARQESLFDLVEGNQL